jgi:acetylornithine deacetylase/succinyl-diaminopimelate desuccinylase-like protein
MDSDKAANFLERYWEQSILPTLCEFIKIPNLSPAFDPEWATNGLMDRAVDLCAGWIRAQEIPGLQLEVMRLPERTPLIYVEIPGGGRESVVMYGHVDKQPPAEGWSEGLGPYTPVIRNGRLYGRGAGDDGYNLFSCIAAIKALRAQGASHPRCVMLIETREESGSQDLAAYVERLKDRIGPVGMIVILDSGAGDYDRLWLTTSLRGLVAGTLRVKILDQGVHSGDASGVVPSSFRIARQLLDRLEESQSGKIRVEALYATIPPERAEQAAATARVIGEAVWNKFPFVAGGKPVTGDGAELLLNRTWRPQLAVTGAAGLPELTKAGNVLRTETALKLSLRIPPRVDPDRAAAVVKQVLEADPPYGAQVRFESGGGAWGWNAPSLPTWLDASLTASSRTGWGADPCFMGEGGTLPLLTLFENHFPGAPFLITGVLGPGSNAHGPDEFLDLLTARRVTATLARAIYDFQKEA